MQPLQKQARALGDPTRHRIFQHLVDAGGPVDISGLTAHLGLTHNGIRQHLAKLIDAGLIVESRAAPAGPGRPRLRYTVDPATDSRWGTTGPYERLAALLAEMVGRGETPVEAGRRAGALLAGDSPGPADPLEVLVDQMARQGFEPTVRRRGDRVVVTLQECPFASAVLADRATVCAVHLGMAQGVAEVVGGLVVEELAVEDPRRAGCRLLCRTVDGPPPDGPPPGGAADR